MTASTPNPDLITFFPYAIVRLAGFSVTQENGQLENDVRRPPQGDPDGQHPRRSLRSGHYLHRHGKAFPCIAKCCLHLIAALTFDQLAWCITFIGCLIGQVQNHTEVFPTYAWWACVYNLMLIIGVFVVIGSDSIHTYHVAVTGFLAAGIITVTSSINLLLYSGSGARQAAAAGFILLAMVVVSFSPFVPHTDLQWIAMLTRLGRFSGPSTSDQTLHQLPARSSTHSPWLRNPRRCTDQQSTTVVPAAPRLPTRSSHLRCTLQLSSTALRTHPPSVACLK